MSFTDFWDKLKIKILAPAVVCRRGLGFCEEKLSYCAGLPALWVFKDEPINAEGYYKAVYMNNKRVRPWSIIPRNALIEIRLKPQKGVVKAIGGIFSSAVKGLKKVVGVIVGIATFGLLGYNVFGIFKKKGVSNGTDTPTYSSQDQPDLTGAKNELLEGVVPIAFGRVLQTFNYGQFAYPLVRSGYSGNRYRVYSVAGYQNARFEDFRLGDVLLSNYRTTAYTLSQANGQSSFIGWDNAVTENFNRELSFDQSQAVFQAATVYYNSLITDTSTSIVITQTYLLQSVNYNNWSNKTLDVSATMVRGGTDETVTNSVTMTKGMLQNVEGTTYRATLSITLTAAGALSEYRYTTTQPNGSTRANSNENSLLITLESETVTIGSQTLTQSNVNQGVNSYNGDRNQLISQSRHNTLYCDIHFNFPQGLYTLDSKGKRKRVTIQAEINWKRVGETGWRGVTDTNIARIYTRDINGNIGNLSSRIGRNVNNFIFNTPADINDADDKFYECVGLQFAEPGHYQVNIMPVVFTKDDYWVGTINVSEVVWRLDPSIPVVSSDMLPHVTQIACTFNATTQLDGEIDQFGAINRPYITNIATMKLEQSRNPVDVLYYLITDTHSNPSPMESSQIDMNSFLKAREWCVNHNCLCDGVITSETKYSAAIDEICNNNQLYFIPNKWGKVVLKVDTNEDNRPIKTLFNADNSWDLSIIRKRGKWNRVLALRCSYVDEETWSQQEITGYWYNNQCNWEPEVGYDDTYYEPEVRELNYVKNADNVKRRIAYELEIANVKNVTASFKVAREVLDLEVLDRVLVADYTRINDGVSGTITDIIQENNMVIGVRTSLPFKVLQGMTITIRSVDLTGEGQNVHTYSLKENSQESSYILLSDPIPAEQNIIRGAGFYQVEGTDFYYTGDLYMAGTAEILNMVISSIEEVSGEDFTSSITCRLY